MKPQGSAKVEALVGLKTERPLSHPVKFGAIFSNADCAVSKAKRGLPNMMLLS